jgi:putative selenate reductase FAD-binding subunit
MITTYHRPQTLDEALTLLSRPNTLPLGGGTLLSRPTPFDPAQGKPDSFEVIDLQALGLDSINKKGGELEIGATATLQQLFESKDCPEALKTAVKFEAPLNIRNSATVAGTLVASDGRSTFTTAMLALDAKIDRRPPTADHGRSAVVSGLGEFLLTRPRGLITSITIPLQKFAFESVSRTPADKPIVSAALAQWASGRTRLALGGYGKSPLLAMDGTEADGLETAARNAYHEANNDWASAEYRMDVAATLAKRCLERIGD